jgi:hypothetical protein
LIYVFFTEFTQQKAGKRSQAQRIKDVEKHRNLLGTPVVVLVQQQQIQRERKARQVISGEVAAVVTLAVGNVTIRFACVAVWASSNSGVGMRTIPAPLASLWNARRSLFEPRPA